MKRFIFITLLLMFSIPSSPLFGCGGFHGPRQIVGDPMGHDTTLIYDPVDGRVALWAGGFGTTVQTFELKSKSELFIPENANDVFNGLFDVVSESKLFKLDPAGFANQDGPFEFGNVLPSQLNAQHLMEDLEFSGSCGVGIGSLHVVPEPTSGWTTAAFFILVVARRRYLFGSC